MRVGKFQLTQCRSLRTTQGRARLAATALASFNGTCSCLCGFAQGRHETNVPGAQPAKDNLTVHHVRCPATISRSFSTTNSLTLLPGERERAYLQPRSTPRFRKRSKEEKELYLAALEASQDGYDIQMPQRVQHNSRQTVLDSDIEPKHFRTTSFSSPFFKLKHTETPDYASNSHVQPSLKRDIRLPKGFPPLSSRPRSDVSTTDLEEELHYISHNDPRPTAIYNLLKILIHDRKIKPASQHYEALILANCWPEYGSVQNVEKILMEMEAEGIEIGGGVFAAVLKVLAIHPSPDLSREVLGAAERRWQQLPSQTQHHLILAMIKTGQTELAAWTLDVLRTRHKTTRISSRPVIPDYLHVLLMVEMTKTDDWEGLLRYMYKLRDRKAADREIPNEFWGWLLENAAKAARNVSELSHLTRGVSNDQHNSGQTTPATRRKRRSANTQDLPPNTTSESQTVPTNPPHQEIITTEPTPTTKPDPNIKRQISLSNPAKYLVEHIWTFYVEPMSVRPSWSTCLDTLHIAAQSGTAWLADSALAVMTYMDGVAADGRPKRDVGHEVHELVRIAREKHAAMKDPDAERGLREAERETKRREEKYEAWWADLMDKLDDGKDRDKTEVSTGGGEGGAEGSDPELAAQHTQEPTVSSTGGKADRYVAGLRMKEYATGERKSPPLANLWPMFPHIDGVGSARVDPWTALGPRSSARGKWTEAQMYYRKQEKANKKK